jgi:hypothetical protein
MTRFQNLLKKVYPPTEAGHASTRAEMLKTAIISFVLDCIVTPLLAEICRASRKRKALTFQHICSRAYKASSDLMTETAIPLYFARNIGQDSAVKLVQFNSIQTTALPMIRPKKTVINDYNRMNHTGFPTYTSPCYPPFPPPFPEAGGQLGPRRSHLPSPKYPHASRQATSTNCESMILRFRDVARVKRIRSGFRRIHSESKLESESRLECQDRHVPFIRCWCILCALKAESGDLLGLCWWWCWLCALNGRKWRLARPL